MTDVPTIIGFSGSIASGKSTTASHVAHWLYDTTGTNYRVVSFATALRREVEFLLDRYHDYIWYKDDIRHVCRGEFFAGVDVDTVQNVFDTAHMSPDSYRTLMQLWGTTIRRAQDPDYFVQTLYDTYKDDTHIIIDDVRFVNEADSVVSRGGVLIRLNISPDVQKSRLVEVRGVDYDTEVLCHESETALDDYGCFHLVVNNDDPAAAEQKICPWLINYKNKEK